MIHKVTLLNGARNLASSILSVPELFKEPSQIIRAAKLQDILRIEIKDNDEKKLNESTEIELTEKQRDLLKQAIIDSAKNIPVGKFSRNLLEQLGFEE